MNKPTHCPPLVNAAEMNRQHPYTFALPSAREVERIGLGSMVKVAMRCTAPTSLTPETRITGERFWLKVVAINKGFMTGEVCNHLVGIPEIKHGDLVRFHFDNIFEVSP